MTKELPRAAPTPAESPAAERNKGPILEALRSRLPAAGRVLEIASGTGQHALHFAQALPALQWQPSDPDAGARTVMAERLRHVDLPNLRDPLALDTCDLPWSFETVDAIVCINMSHISPWRATEALFRESGRLLPPNGGLFVYGPFLRNDVPIAPSNLAFDQNLRRRNPEWGLRSLDDVSGCAGAHGLALAEVLELPANNLLLVFRQMD